MPLGYPEKGVAIALNVWLREKQASLSRLHFLSSLNLIIKQIQEIKLTLPQPQIGSAATCTESCCQEQNIEQIRR